MLGPKHVIKECLYTAYLQYRRKSHIHGCWMWSIIKNWPDKEINTIHVIFIYVGHDYYFLIFLLFSFLMPETWTIVARYRTGEGQEGREGRCCADCYHHIFLVSTALLDTEKSSSKWRGIREKLKLIYLSVWVFFSSQLVKTKTAKVLVVSQPASQSARHLDSRQCKVKATAQWLLHIYVILV